ncbi:MAG: YraN family protein [Bacillota bacterium]|nr:YraN family protein [Bacillota bacterium]
MSKKSDILGAWGEELTTAHLEKLGYRILARNFRRREGEIDIIAAKDETTFFVEVKSRSQKGFARPADSITPKKRRRIAKAATLWFIEQEAESASSLLIAEVYPQSGEILLFEDFLC